MWEAVPCSGSDKCQLLQRKEKKQNETKMPKVGNKKKVRVSVIPRRKMAVARNKPNEVTRLGYALRALGGLGGGVIGGAFGMPSAGNSAGTGIGAAISKWLGSGDYEVVKNSVVAGSQKMSGSVPEMHKSDQSIIVRHKEFITTVNSSTGFSVQSSFDINPGNATLFPWLAGVASRFQEYKLRGMVYHYVPTSGSAVSSTNAALGAVMLQTTYRASDAPPSNKIEMLNEYNSNESVPCEAFCHPIECDPKENPFNIQYVRSVTTTTAEDKLLYDLGTTHLAVQGCQTDGNPIGDLWVTYEVELKKPLVASNITSQFSTYGAVIQSPAGTAAMFNGSITTNGSLPITLAGNTILFPKGRVGSYQISVRLTGVMTAYSWANTVTLTNCSAITGPPGFSNLTTTKAGATDSIDGATKLTWVQVLDPSQQASVLIPTPVITGSFTTTVITISLYNPLV